MGAKKNKLPKELVKRLDTLSDAEFENYLDIKFGHDEDAWEECSKEEYEEKMDVYSSAHSFNCAFYRQEFVYKTDPSVKDVLSGLDIPIGRKYYKRNGTIRVIKTTPEMEDYIAERRARDKKNPSANP